MPEIAELKIEGKTLADGIETVESEVADRFTLHQVHLELSGLPTAGTLAIAIRTPGASEFATIGTVDLTDPTAYLQQFTGLVAEWQFTPALINPAGTTWSAFICSGEA